MHHGLTNLDWVKTNTGIRYEYGMALSGLVTHILVHSSFASLTRRPH